MAREWAEVPLGDVITLQRGFDLPSQNRKPGKVPIVSSSGISDSFHESPLGHIPKGWETGSILRQADLLSGGTPKTDIPAYWNGDVPWASAKDVSQCGEAFLVSTERTITTQGVDESSTKIIPANATVVVARGATTGRLTMFGHAMAMNQTCYGLRSTVGAPFALYCNARHFIERLVKVVTAAQSSRQKCSCNPFKFHTDRLCAKILGFRCQTPDRGMSRARSKDCRATCKS